MDLLIFASGATTIWCKYFSTKLLVFFKPITLILIILLALINSNFTFTNYSTLIVFGLIFGLIGDIFLIFPEKYFKLGLLSFLLGHILYISAFTKSGIDLIFALPVFAYLAFGVIFYLNIKKYLQNYSKYVLIYMSVIAFMAGSSAGNYLTEYSYSALLAFIGANLFLISDSVLAFNKFVKKHKYSEVAILSSYYLAQYFIASSI